MLYFKFILWTHPKLAALVLPFSMSREGGTSACGRGVSQE